MADRGAGRRVVSLMREREKEQDAIRSKQAEIKKLNKVGKIDNKFSTHYDSVENALKSQTVGLVTVKEMKEKQESLVKQREQELSHTKVGKELKYADSAKDIKAKLAEEQKKRMLSFNPEDDEDDNIDDDIEQKPCVKAEYYEDFKPGTSAVPAKKSKMCKDPTVDTSFLPDKEREEEENRLRERYMAEWKERQDQIKKEWITVAYCYFDGSGHRRDMKIQKGATIGEFLHKALSSQLRDSFMELKGVSGDHLMMVKEDVIIPQYHSFYDFIVTKAKGKCGPLYIWEDTGLDGEWRMVDEGGNVEVPGEAHPAKVVLRSWYEKNKHIYPASRWESFEPNKKYDLSAEADFERRGVGMYLTAEDDDVEEVGTP